MRKKILIASQPIYGASGLRLTQADLQGIGLVVGLSTILFPPARFPIRFLHYPMEDMEGVPADWNEFVAEIDNYMKTRKLPILVYCDGGCGRTGTLLASLIARAEPETEDPLAAVRERFREDAVETLDQAKAIFRIRGQRVPKTYLPWLDPILVTKLFPKAWGGLV